MTTERTIATMNATELLEEFKRHIRMTSSDLDSELRSKLMAAVFHAEHFIGKIILRSTFVVEGEFTSSVTLKVPRVDVESVEVDGVEVDDYSVSRKTLSIGSSVSGETMTVTYDAGYEAIPFDMKAAILMHATTLFEHPGDSVETLAKASDNLLRHYRSWGLDDGE